MRHDIDPARDECRRCSLTSEDIVRLPFGQPRCDPARTAIGERQGLSVDKFIAHRAKERRS